eukprot:Nk52_evm5s1967 gene=Nk52_evmTU5s1967
MVVHSKTDFCNENEVTIAEQGRKDIIMSHLPKTDSRVHLEEDIESEVERYHFEVDHDNLDVGVRSVIIHFKSDWTEDKLHIKQFTEGMTNKLFCCSQAGMDEKVLIRVYGKNTDKLIDREQEVVNMVSLSSKGLAPYLYGRFDNGCAYGFFPGTPLDMDGMSDPHIAPLTAKRLGEWHGTHIPGDMRPLLFDTLARWRGLIPENYDNAERNATFKEKIDLKQLESELAVLKDIVETKLKSPVVFAHNDLLCKNILYDNTTDTVNFIDYEYGTYNYRGFDIGNHFCEFAGMESVLDYERFPSKEFQMEFLNHYLYYLNEAKPTPEEVEALYKEVQVFALIAHFYWGFWGLVQESISDIDYGYLSFAIQRFEEYFRRKDAFLKLVEDL